MSLYSVNPKNALGCFLNACQISGRAITYHLIFQTLQQFILVQNMFVPSNPLLINLENCLVLENVFNMKVTFSLKRLSMKKKNKKYGTDFIERNPVPRY